MDKGKGVPPLFDKEATADAVVDGPNVDKGKSVVLALFENEAAADAAVDGLKAWDDIDDDVKLNAIGMMVLDEDGKLKMHKVGRRRGIAKGVAGGAIAVRLAGYLVTPLGLPVAPLDAANSPQKGGVQRVTPPRRAPGRSGPLCLAGGAGGDAAGSESLRYWAAAHPTHRRSYLVGMGHWPVAALQAECDTGQRSFPEGTRPLVVQHKG